jgi:hypothetical protein
LPTQFPFADLTPLGILAAAQALDQILRPQVLQHTPDHVHAEIRAHVAKFGDGERAERPVDSLKHEACLLAFGTLKLAKALLELPASGFDDEVDTGMDSNFREKSRKVIMIFPFHKATDHSLAAQRNALTIQFG